MRERWISAGLVAGLALLAAEPLFAQQRQMAPALQPDPSLNAEDQLAPSQIKQPMPAAVPEPSARTSPFDGAFAKACGGRYPNGVRRRHGEAIAARGLAHRRRLQRPLRKRFKRARPRNGLRFEERHIYRCRRRVRQQGAGLSPVSEGSEAAARSVVVQSGEPQRHLSHRDQRPIDLDRAGRLAPRPHFGRNWKSSTTSRSNSKASTKTISRPSATGMAARSPRLPGGCKSGVSLRADPKAAADAVSALPADHEYSSADPAMRAVKPTVSEILIGY